MSKNVSSCKFAAHQSLPCVKGGGPAERRDGGIVCWQSFFEVFLDKSMPVNPSVTFGDSFLYTREPWALPCQYDIGAFSAMHKKSSHPSAVRNSKTKTCFRFGSTNPQSSAAIADLKGGAKRTLPDMHHVNTMGQLPIKKNKIAIAIAILKRGATERVRDDF